jgi:hypothetical protein
MKIEGSQMEGEGNYFKARIASCNIMCRARSRVAARRSGIRKKVAFMQSARGPSRVQ